MIRQEKKILFHSVSLVSFIHNPHRAIDKLVLIALQNDEQNET